MNPLQSIYVLLFLYSLLLGLCWWVWKRKSDKITSVAVTNGYWGLLHLRHAAGIFIMFPLSAFLLPGLPLQLLRIPDTVSGFQALAILLTALIILVFVSKEKKPDEYKTSNRFQGARYQIIVHIILRTIFLVSYEWFFRGCLLSVCISEWGLVPAIIINLSLYALIHSFNGKKEWLGSVPFGLVLCVFTIWTQSIWPAIFLHLLLSSSYESVVLKPYLIKYSKYKS